MACGALRKMGMPLGGCRTMRLTLAGAFFANARRKFLHFVAYLLTSAAPPLGFLSCDLALRAGSILLVQLLQN